MAARRRYKWSPRTGELMSFVTMTPGVPALRGRPDAWNAFVVVQGDKVLVVAVARHADSAASVFRYPLPVEAGQSF